MIFINRLPAEYMSPNGTIDKAEGKFSKRRKRGEKLGKSALISFQGGMNIFRIGIVIRLFSKFSSQFGVLPHLTPINFSL